MYINQAYDTQFRNLKLNLFNISTHVQPSSTQIIKGINFNFSQKTGISLINTTIQGKIFIIPIFIAVSEQFRYSETLNKEYIERIHQMSYFSLSDNINGMLSIFSFLIK